VVGDPPAGYALAPNSGTRDPATGSNRTCENGESIFRRSGFGSGRQGYGVEAWLDRARLVGILPAAAATPAHVQPNLVAKNCSEQFYADLRWAMSAWSLQQRFDTQDTHDETSLGARDGN